MKPRRRLSGEAIIVTGTPGTGKTTFSTMLAKDIGAKYVSLTQFVSTRGLYTRVDSKRQSKVVDLKRVQARLKTMLRKSGGLTIVDTHIPEIAPKNRVKSVFVLRCHPKVLEKRLKSKKWKPSKILENVLAEVLDVCLTHAVGYYGTRRIFQLDTSRANVTKCVAAAKRIVQKPPRRKIRIDWIMRLDRERLLDKYLGL